jgi:hypothetical protein
MVQLRQERKTRRRAVEKIECKKEGDRPNPDPVDSSKGKMV